MKYGISALVIAGAALIAAPALAGKGDRMWEKLDTNGDGQLSLSEMNDRHREFFMAADANGDGLVSKAEMKAHHEQKRAERMAKRFPDADGDGVVSKAEFDAAADERFMKLDANADGVLSKEEMEDARGHGRRGGKRR